MTRGRPLQDDQRQKRFEDFLVWFKANITGKERAQGQIYFDRLLQAFGNGGVLEAGAACEDPVKKKSGHTGFADLVWKPRVIIELKERGTHLKKHYAQAEEYWMHLVPNRPQYMVLCNFDEFWIYDLNTQLNDPVHTMRIENLAKEWGALGFLFPTPEKPLFTNNNVEVTEEVAKVVGAIYLSLESRKVDPHRAQRFVLQLVVALFAEDVNLIPKYTIQRIMKEAVADPVTQKELTLLFEAMASDKEADKPKKYKHIPYFNGGLFRDVSPVELNFKELDLLATASTFDWSKVRPSIFGSIFEGSMDPEKRHGHGVHYTSELDIQKIVNPTIVRPFRARIEKAKNRAELGKILDEIQKFKVLDPACGSGNFLYIAFRELRRLEVEILERMDKNFDPRQMRFGLISPKNFYGIDTNEFGLELAKVALSIGRKLSADEFGIADNVLPFDNLDKNFSPEDALFTEWPKVNAIIGNPPFQSKNKMQTEFGKEYMAKLRAAYPEISGYADYCVYWFRRAHDHLQPSGRAGLVGTNTIRQNQSRESGLDYIASNDGQITEAVSTQIWSGDAVVHVSIVNWLKGEEPGSKRLYTQKGDDRDSPWEVCELASIPPTLSTKLNISSSGSLLANTSPALCFQGQTHGHAGFLLDAEQVRKEPDLRASVGSDLFPFLIGDELVGNVGGKPERYVIDFGDRSIQAAMKNRRLFPIVERLVLPERKAKAEKEERENAALLKANPKAKPSNTHIYPYSRWWLLRRAKPDMLNSLNSISRYIACARVTKRPIFEFVSASIHPGDALVAFSFDDDYSFGVISSAFHWLWFTERCSTLKGDFRYTADTVWNTFPWPQAPTEKQIRAVADAGIKLRSLRNKIMNANQWSLRELYRSLELPGENPLRVAHEDVDQAVRSAYGFKAKSDPLSDLLSLNLDLAKKETAAMKIQGPGLPRSIKNAKAFISSDCITP